MNTYLDMILQKVYGDKGKHVKGGKHHDDKGHKAADGHDHHRKHHRKHSKSAGEKDAKKWAHKNRH